MHIYMNKNDAFLQSTLFYQLQHFDRFRECYFDLKVTYKSVLRLQPVGRLMSLFVKVNILRIYHLVLQSINLQPNPAANYL